MFYLYAVHLGVVYTVRETPRGWIAESQDTQVAIRGLTHPCPLLWALQACDTVAHTKLPWVAAKGPCEIP